MNRWEKIIKATSTCRTSAFNKKKKARESKKMVYMSIEGRRWQKYKFLCVLCECFPKLQLAAFHLPLWGCMFIIPVAKIHIITIAISLWEYCWAPLCLIKWTAVSSSWRSAYSLFQTLQGNTMRIMFGTIIKRKGYSHVLGRWEDCFLWSSRNNICKAFVRPTQLQDPLTRPILSTHYTF